MTQKKVTRNKEQPVSGENGIWLFKELGIYDEEPEKDKKNNEELIKFLSQLGVKKATIQFSKVAP